MQTQTVITRRPLDELENDIIKLAARINAAEYEFLVLLREFDLRQGWKAYLFNNCAEWLNMKCGLSVSTGHEKLRVATALFDLPLICEAFAEGSLSYSKVRSLSRVATPRNEQDLLDFALLAPVSQLQAHCQQLSNAQRTVSTAEANRLHRRRALYSAHHSDGSVTISVQLPKEAGELVIKALEVAMTAQQAEQSAGTDASTEYFARNADALVDIARAYLAGDNDQRTSTADHYQVLVHVDSSALAGKPSETAKSDLPIETVRRLSCDGAVVGVTKDDKGEPMQLGRKHRIVQPALRRALITRDKFCRYPGCTHQRWLDAHHVIHWADGGETSLSNTLLLCSSHHRLLHEGGYSIKKAIDDSWCFVHASGKIIPDAPMYRLKPGDYDPSRDDFVKEAAASYLFAPPATGLSPGEFGRA